MATVLERVLTGEVLLSDGAMGSILIAKGLEAGDCPERLCLENRSVLRDIAQSYFDAGSDIIHTNSFGGSPIKLKQYGLDHKARDINARAVEIVRKVVKNDRIVAASIGPSGGMLAPYGELTEEELLISFAIQVSATIDAGADMLTIETMTDLAEGRVAIKAGRSVSDSIPIFATMTFDATPKGFYTMMGNKISDVASGLVEAGANGIGSNCGNGIVNMVAIAKDFVSVTKQPVMIQSNAGLPELVDGKLMYSESPDFMAEKVRELLEMGVRIVGGCCGTTPDYIRAFRKVIDERSG